jgi:hypothetical protein
MNATTMWAVSSPVVSASAHLAAAAAEDQQNEPDDENDDTRGPQDRDCKDETQQQQDNSGDNHGKGLPGPALSETHNRVP